MAVSDKVSFYVYREERLYVVHVFFVFGFVGYPALPKGVLQDWSGLSVRTSDCPSVTCFSQELLIRFSWFF